MKPILVLGGTGLLGKPVVSRLVAEGTGVRVLARRMSEAVAVLDPRVEIQQGDATDPSALAMALNGCDGVHISISGPDEAAVVEAVVAAAPTSGVRRITYLSGATVHPDNGWFPMVAQKLRSESVLTESTVPATVLCPTWPMEQLPRFVIDGRATVIGDQATPLHWFAADDLARMITKAFRTEDAAERRLFVHGPEGLTMHEALTRFCAAARPDVGEVTTIPLAAARAAAEAGDNEVLRFMTEMMAYFDQAGEGGDPTEANQLLGGPATTLDEWLTDYTKMLNDRKEAAR